MKKYQYSCRLLSEVIIASSSATEGFNLSLDYIPGAKFLGIVAGRLYSEAHTNPLKILDLFHNGKVRFGDASPYFDEEPSLRIPYSWFQEKGSQINDEIYLHHKESTTDKQLKQLRIGYFSPSSHKRLKIPQDFNLKSAYDSKTRKAKDEQMFGYFSLPKDSSWTFVIEDDSKQYADEIKGIICGRHRVGRSRSAEYGLVEITFDREITENEALIFPAGEMLIYAQSNLCFYDEYGKTTLQPTVEQLKLPVGSTINWSKSQIRSRVYQTWNRKRFNRDADRQIIERGSVFYVETPSSVSSEGFSVGLGSHQAEGLGKVIVNPSFLQSSNATLGFRLQKLDIKDAWTRKNEGTIVQSTQDDEILLQYLNDKAKNTLMVFGLDKKVNCFIQKFTDVYNGVSASQWGMIRDYATWAENLETFEGLLFDPECGALYRGQSEAIWRKNNRRDELKNYLNQFEGQDKMRFTIKLCAEMAKLKNSKNENNA
jgi:hypothetical protein